MRMFRFLLFGAGLVGLGALPAQAHHVKELEADIRKRDHYFQPEDREAPNFALETAEGRKVSLDDFKGKVVVLDFIYGRCKDVCPLQSQMLASIQLQINRTPMRDLVEFVSIATDTEDAKATAEIMRGYGAAHGFDPANWIFLYRGSGAPDAGIKAAAAYGLKFTITEGGDQMHGVVTHVIDQDGKLRARLHGLDFNPIDLILFVNALTNDLHAPGVAEAAHRAAADEMSPGATAVDAPLWFLLALGAVAAGLIGSVFLLVRAIRR